MRHLAATRQVQSGRPLRLGKDGDSMVESTGRAAIASPHYLHLQDGDQISYGAHQLWYRTLMGRMGGCGPTAAANLLWYLAATRPDACGPLFDSRPLTRPRMLELMDALWRYITPGMRGVDKASTLTDGAIRYGADRGVALGARVLDIPADSGLRPTGDSVWAFLRDAFGCDLPIAFLNLSNGRVKNLDNWHWVTLVSADSSLQAEMYDQSRRQSIDLDLWLSSTKGGGAFVALEPR